MWLIIDARRDAAGKDRVHGAPGGEGQRPDRASMVVYAKAQRVDMERLGLALQLSVQAIDSKYNSLALKRPTDCFHKIHDEY
jgi:hypothetical protein